MSIKTAFITIRDNYVINQVTRLKLPAFSEDKTVRYRITFSGRVQHVGFRLEVSELARRLELTGFCQNLENGDVLAEFQGPKNRIKFLVTFLESLKRIKITNKTVERLPLKEGETAFQKEGKV